MPPTARHGLLSLGRACAAALLEQPEKLEQRPDSESNGGDEAYRRIVYLFLSDEQEQRNADDDQQERRFHYLPGAAPLLSLPALEVLVTRRREDEAPEA